MIAHFLWYWRLYRTVILWSWTVMIAKAVWCGRCVRVLDRLTGLMLCDDRMSMYSSVYLIIGGWWCIVLSLQYIWTLSSLIVLFHPHVFQTMTTKMYFTEEILKNEWFSWKFQIEKSAWWCCPWAITFLYVDLHLIFINVESFKVKLHCMQTYARQWKHISPQKNLRLLLQTYSDAVKSKHIIVNIILCNDYRVFFIRRIGLFEYWYL